MAGAIVAAVAALAGVLLQALIGGRRARAERRRAEFVDTVRGVLAAYVEFRSEQYLKIAARREGHGDSDESRRARYAARSALTAAIDALYTATDDQQLLAAAEEARELAVALGDAAPAPGQVDETAVEEIGQRARESHSDLRQAAHKALHH
ncbi:hypothetical protein [Streptomyces luteocolor]|uniref:hypothetical protein n=1 Tax=Streptomyces luteocolor TaxID=285500 RepID=UPI000852FB36|nr:hypothetical protein [Streptomyces luteocolor]